MFPSVICIIHTRCQPSRNLLKSIGLENVCMRGVCFREEELLS